MQYYAYRDTIAIAAAVLATTTFTESEYVICYTIPPRRCREIEIRTVIKYFD